VFLALLSCTPTKTENSKPMLITTAYIDSFQLKNPDKIVVEQYAKMSDANDSIPAKSSKEITEKAKIMEIISLINQLPDEGDIMVKMGDVPLIRVNLQYDTFNVYFDFYNKRIKTPATSFYSTESEVEKKIYSLVTN
jgi:hypothetical protein